jgi:TonB family protein
MRRWRELGLALLLSAGLHAGWVLWAARLKPLAPAPGGVAVRDPVEIDVIGPKHADDETDADDEKKKRLPVVDILRPTFEEKSADARYAALYDANPAVEMKPSAAAAAAADARTASGDPRLPPHASDRPPAVSPPARAEPPGSKVAYLSTPENRGLGVGALRLGRLDGATDAGDGLPADAVRPGGAPAGGDPSLLPGPSEAGISDHDYLPDVAEGPGKLLKTKHYRFAGFFLRLKDDVVRYWHAREAYAEHDPTGEVYGIKDRYTQLYVKLSKDGHVVDVAVAVSSGLDFLDTEALSAIKLAAPFQHPPPELADDDGFIRFYFGFYLYVSGSPEVKVFRY